MVSEGGPLRPARRRGGGGRSRGDSEPMGHHEQRDLGGGIEQVERGVAHRLFRLEGQQRERKGAQCTAGQVHQGPHEQADPGDAH